VQNLFIVALAIILAMLLFRNLRGASTPQPTYNPPPPEINKTAAQSTSSSKVEEGLRKIFASAEAELQAPQRDETPLPQLDLQGPWVCQHKSRDGRRSLYISQSRVRFNDGVRHILFVDDCVYEWTKSKGVKYCEVGQYLKLLDTLVSGGMVDLREILDMSGNLLPKDEITRIVTSCRRAAVADSNFSLPRNVTFTESSIF
jgi:hypothetical protein